MTRPVVIVRGGTRYHVRRAGAENVTRCGRRVLEDVSPADGEIPTSIFCRACFSAHDAAPLKAAGYRLSFE